MQNNAFTAGNLTVLGMKPRVVFKRESNGNCIDNFCLSVKVPTASTCHAEICGELFCCEIFLIWYYL
jgi:hypothetical protein